MKILYSILKYVYILGIIAFTLPTIYLITGGFLSYFFDINIIADHSSSFGKDLPIKSLIWFAEKWISFIALFISIFLIKRKWFFIYVPAIIIINAIFGLILINLNPKIAFDLFFWIPLIYIGIFYLVNKKIHEKKAKPDNAGAT